MTESKARHAVLEIKGLASGGDGVANTEHGTIFIPFALPGETVAIGSIHNRHAELEAVLTPSADRVTPTCSLFGACGGCTLQHLAPEAILTWKTSQVMDALTRAGYADLPAPIAEQVPPYSRRRIDLTLKRIPGGMIAGLHQKGGDPVDMTECHVLHPTLFALLAPIRSTFATLGAITSTADLLINLLDSGPDLLLSTERPITAPDRTKLAAFAKAHKIARIGWKPRTNGPVSAEPPEILVQHGQISHHFAETPVAIPIGAFMQASAPGEQAIVAATKAALPKLNRRDIIVELFAGCGTLSFPLAQSGRTLAYEGEVNAINAVRSASMGRRVEAHHRDLGRQPIMAKELSAAKVVVLDPPFSGATPQCRQIANSTIGQAIYVSCNPAALANDAKLLKQAGFKVASINVVDQFLWSTGIESIVSFKRESSRHTRSGPSR